MKATGRFEGPADGRARGRVLYVQYTNAGAYPPLVHSAELLTAMGGHVRVLSMASRSDPRRMSLPRVDERRMAPAAVSALRPLHFMRYAMWAAWHAIVWRPDWIYASDTLSAPVVRTLGRLTRARVLYHEHDSPSDGEATVTSGVRGWLMKARRAVVADADLCVAPGEARADAMARHTGRRDIEVVWNCPLRREVGPRPEVRNGLRVVYHGSVVPARVPLTLVDALATLPEDVTLTIVGYQTVGHPRHVAAIEARARECGVAHRVTCRPPVSRDDLMASGPRFDVGVALLPTGSEAFNEQSMIGPSNKPLDYMASGLALLVSARPEWIETFVEPGFGVSCAVESAESIAEALRWLRDHPAERVAMAAAGQRRILDRWNYEAAFGPIATRLLPGASPASAVSRAGHV